MSAKGFELNVIVPVAHFLAGSPMLLSKLGRSLECVLLSMTCKTIFINTRRTACAVPSLCGQNYVHPVMPFHIRSKAQVV
eukprot:scaffold60477_cov19-Tisochrysis_lutea.AAC.2